MKPIGSRPFTALALALALPLLAGLPSTAAAETDTAPASAQAPGAIRELLRGIRGMQRLPVAGVQMVEAGERVLFVSDNGRYVFTGPAWDLWHGAKLETLEAADAAETALKKQFDFASKRLEVGLAPITDVHEARAQYDAARANSILARNAVQDAYQALVEITGTPVGNLKGLPDDFQPALPESRDVEGWVATALSENPSLKAQAADVEAAEHNVATARSGHYPTLGLRAGYGKALPGLYGNPEFTGSNDASTSVGLTLSIPIFSGFATQSGVRSALAQRDIARDQLEQQKRALERNTRNAYQALVAGISEVEARRLALVSAQSAYEASQVGLEVGTRTVLDVLNNQRTLFSAQQDYAQAKYNFLQNRLLLEQAAGTLQLADLEDVNRLLTTDESVAKAIGTQ